MSLQQLDSSESSGDKLPTSASLLDRARHRDDLAWNELVELYAPLVYFWCRKTNIVEQDIPDVVQEVFRAVATDWHSGARTSCGGLAMASSIGVWPG